MAKHAEDVGTLEAARLLRRSLQQVHRLLWEGKLRGIKRDGKWRIPVAEIEERRKRQGGEHE